jgi:hypothetical protein
VVVRVGQPVRDVGVGIDPLGHAALLEVDLGGRRAEALQADAEVLASCRIVCVDLGLAPGAEQRSDDHCPIRQPARRAGPPPRTVAAALLASLLVVMGRRSVR